MNEQIEIEYKILIDKETYSDIVKKYEKQIINHYTQTNYYFTHPLFFEKKYMLRIREKQNYFELTLKRPYKGHRLETNVELSKEEADLFFNHQDIDNEIINILKEEGIKVCDLIQQFSLTTKRYDIQEKYGILSLDYNEYNGINDYEIEYEVFNKELGLLHFKEIISEYNLEYTKNAKSKIQRVLESI